MGESADVFDVGRPVVDRPVAVRDCLPRGRWRSACGMRASSCVVARKWYAKTWSVVLAVALLVVLWVALAFHLIAFDVNY